MNKITKIQLKSIIAEEVSRILSENTADIKVGDYVTQSTSTPRNDRGQRMIDTVVNVGKVTQVQDDNLTVQYANGQKNSLSAFDVARLPRKGEKFAAVWNYDFGAGSGGQGQQNVSGTVVGYSLAAGTIAVDGPNIKKNLPMKQLSNIKIR